MPAANHLTVLLPRYVKNRRHYLKDRHPFSEVPSPIISPTLKAAGHAEFSVIARDPPISLSPYSRQHKPNINEPRHPGGNRVIPNDNMEWDNIFDAKT